ncbi:MULTISPECIES: type IV secretion system protein VirB10 [Mesorhizobium]|uniref:type IV secretion system protein VirB10 n=1 Tax=Mesorhizobium TaxID=68287 RepID=UPI0007EDF665|nr:MULTISPECIES: type IV secretion system protein VirB10 [Mesorhizobium]TPJ38302.1 type IV secretion system protein VirB10 [Mesorhizobium sp. B2-6-6]ARP67172.1 type IV secretion system protein VirB10 [Mesorhizobium sp. WSM1497]MCA0002749.1 type IV secretion system protein VirB10 [Mesorhizobium sp. B264B2A]MCA0009100.1 type IV secretion system protein VirB10 [Mesorhizobium sp. B264B1B]MCA0014503.1 type IV secretion system protein VirB10 [Mesorhizobium sp. B294B1A1]
MNETGPQAGHDVHASGSMVSEPARRHVSGSQKLAVAALVLISSLSLIWLGGRSSTQDEPSQPKPPIVANVEPFRPVPIEVAPEPPAPAEAAKAAEPAPSTPPPPAADDPPPEESPIFAYSGSGQMPNADQRSEDKQNDAPGTADEISNGGDLSGRLKPDIQEPSRATLLPHPDLVITQGTIIPCILQTAVDTNLPGYVKCVLPKAVRGATNNVVLLDRGTTVIGEIQRGLQQGDARVFVLWTRIETPDHALVSIASPGADELGRSGMPGTVDNHFRERFGGAILMSVIQGAFQAAGQYAASSGGGSGTNSFQSNGGQAVETTLRATINLPPTLKKNQGDAVSIFVARDLDFSDVYDLRATAAAPSPQHRERRRNNNAIGG